jgi:hypothetical protein
MKMYLPLGVFRTTSLKVNCLEFEDLSTVTEPKQKQNKKKKYFMEHDTVSKLQF